MELCEFTGGFEGVVLNGSSIEGFSLFLHLKWLQEHIFKKSLLLFLSHSKFQFLFAQHQNYRKAFLFLSNFHLFEPYSTDAEYYLEMSQNGLTDNTSACFKQNNFLFNLFSHDYLRNILY